MIFSAVLFVLLGEIIAHSFIPRSKEKHARRPRSHVLHRKGICLGRTVSSQANTYTSLLQVADTCLSTRYALLSLLASYLSKQLPKDKDTYHQSIRDSDPLPEEW
jgi:hypothetical protein